MGRLTGPAQINTDKGHITITEALHGTVVLRTQAGDVSVGAARATSAGLDAGTSHGRIHTLSNTHGTTTYGDITARSL